jgi:hypothetical protein
MENAQYSPRLGQLGRMAAVMSSRVQLSVALIVVAALMVQLDPLYFASLRPGYSHLSNTISEFAETGASHAQLVWLALWLVHREAPDRQAFLILAAMSCLGTGYAMAAVFPCDPGAPLFGGKYSWYQKGNQPVLVVGEPRFRIAIIMLDRVRSRMRGDRADNIPFFFDGFSSRIRKAKPGDDSFHV